MISGLLGLRIEDAYTRARKTLKEHLETPLKSMKLTEIN